MSEIHDECNISNKHDNVHHYRNNYAYKLVNNDINESINGNLSIIRAIHGQIQLALYHINHSISLGATI